MYNDRRSFLTAVFEDTQKQIETNEQLAVLTEQGRRGTRFYGAGHPSNLRKQPDTEPNVAVTKARTFEAAVKLKKGHPDWRVGVLNFASATNPGGGVKNGSSAQEECLCRCSNLYPMLNQKWLWDMYYRKNREENNALHTDDCIYCPGVTIFKSDIEYPLMLLPEEWTRVDVISCAAPNLREKPGNRYNPEAAERVEISAKELYDIHLRRGKRILDVAAKNKIDAMVLGAFGCGAFMNDPAVVAEAWRDVVAERGGYFKYLEFAVFCRPYDTTNYDVFRATIKPNTHGR